MKNKNDGYGQHGMVEKQDGTLTPAQWLPKPATIQLPNLGRALRALWSRPAGRGGHDFSVCSLPALTAVLALGLVLTGCMSTPHTTIAGKLNGSPFLIEAPKDGDLTGFDLTADSNGVLRVHIDHLSVKMNPEVIGQSGAAQAGIIQATGVVASNITAAAVAAALRAN
jgi:hypothetical protein